MAEALQYGFRDANAYSTYYKFSGRTSPKSLIVAGLAGVPLAVACGVIYALIVRFVPFVKLMFLATMGFGFLVGYATSEVMRWSRLRSPAVAMAAVGVITLAGYYAAWVVWEYTLMPADGPTVWQLAARPDVVVRVIGMAYEHGTWSMSRSSSTPVSGLPLAFVWLLEAASVFGIALVVTRERMTYVPFCERCQAWCKRRADFGTSGDARDPGELRRRLEARDFDYLRTLGLKERLEGRSFLTYRHEACPQCDQFHALTVLRTTFYYDKKKKELATSKAVPLVSRLLITSEEAATIQPGQIPRAVMPVEDPPVVGVATTTAAGDAGPLEGTDGRT